MAYMDLTTCSVEELRDYERRVRPGLVDYASLEGLHVLYDLERDEVYIVDPDRELMI